MNAAFDWQLLIGTTASIITIAKVLWSSDIKNIKPIQEKGKTDTFLFISIKNKKKQFIQVFLGKENLMLKPRIKLLKNGLN